MGECVNQSNLQEAQYLLLQAEEAEGGLTVHLYLILVVNGGIKRLDIWKHKNVAFERGPIINTDSTDPCRYQQRRGAGAR